MTSEPSYVWNGSFCTTELDDRVVVLVMDSGKYFSMAKTGMAIFKILEAPHSISSLVDTLMASYAVSRERCQQETTAFVALMLDSGLLKKTEA